MRTEEQLDLELTYETLGLDQRFYDQLHAAPSDIRMELLDLVENIEMLSWMMSPEKDRGYAKDKPKDSKGRVIVDIVKPHILEDMDYFRQPALYFRQHGKFTNLHSNPHPNSEYKRFWEEETRRCKEGLIRESDGEWIPGYYYWYLNYSPIMLTVVNEEGSTRAERIQDFPDVWDSDYLFYHYVEQGEEESEYGSVLKTRGRGYSFKVASMLDRNFYLFKKSKNFAFASENEYLTKDGILNKCWAYMEFIDDNTAWKKLKQKKDTMDNKRASYIDSSGTERGYMSEIMGVTTKGNPEKGRGKRGKLLVHEEGGIYPGLLQTWNIARPSIEDGDYTFGYQIVFGTGGTPSAKFDGLEELFYRGGGYKVKMLRNVWDKVKGQGTCGFFVPEYMNRKGCYDKDGNSNVVKALVEILLGRKKIRENASKENALTQEKAERPITPQEAVMRVEGTLFPVDEIKSYLEEIIPEQNRFVSKHYIGKLGINSNTGKIEYKPDADVKVIREFPLKDNINKQGAIEIFEMPVTDGAGNIPRFRYIAGGDPIDDDASTTNSLASIFIMDILTDRIVAEYTGRPRTANEYYETCLRLLKFYNAILNYENDKKGLFAYFSHRNMVSYLAGNPQILKDMEMIKATNLYGNKAIGTNSGPRINAWGRRLQADWMLEPAYGEEGKGLINLHKIRSIGYLREAISWNPDINTDRVSAMGMLMILREEYKKYKLQISDHMMGTRVKQLSNDPFFSVNFGRKGGEKVDPVIKAIHLGKTAITVG
jgi:hypothetical protein